MRWKQQPPPQVECQHQGLTGLESEEQPSDSWAKLAIFCKLFGDQVVTAAPPQALLCFSLFKSFLSPTGGLLPCDHTAAFCNRGWLPKTCRSLRTQSWGDWQSISFKARSAQMRTLQVLCKADASHIFRVPAFNKDLTLGIRALSSRGGDRDVKSICQMSVS